MLEKGCYPVKHLEMMDCLVDPYSLRRLALYVEFTSKSQLLSIVITVFTRFNDALKLTPQGTLFYLIKDALELMQR